VKKGQGAKNRSTYFEALHGEAAGGFVGFFMAKSQQRQLASLVISALKKLKNPSRIQNQLLKRKMKELAALDNEIAQLLQDAPQQFPHFLVNLAKAKRTKGPVYPAEVRMLEAVVYLRYIEPQEKMTLEEMEAGPISVPEKVPYQRLFELTQDENGSPSASRFSDMVKRHKVPVERAKAGRRKN
jgi:hypothetical protein